MQLSITNGVITLTPTYAEDLAILNRICPKEGDSVALVRGPVTTDQGKFVLESVAPKKAAAAKDVLKERPKKEK